LFVHPVFSQSTEKLSKADQAFLLQNYYEAELLYKKKYSKEKNRAKKAELIFLQAECNRLIGTPIRTKKASSLYKRAIKAKYPHAEVYLRYAQVLQKQQYFEESISQFTKYKSLKPDDIRSAIGLKSCQFAINALADPSRYECTPFQYNSSSSDFAPSFGNGDYDVLFFTSSREGSIGKNQDGFTGNSYTDIYSVKRDDKKGKWMRPVAFPEPMNTKEHEAATSLNLRGTEMYFTRCSESNKIKPIPTCEIFYTKKKGKGWIAPVLLPLPYDSISSFGHPSISKDGKLLYFSSDMKGGQGGKDIWVIKKLNRDEWSEPINLGSEVNTPGNELFPFIHDDRSLYFSSDGHIGMGGLDIFKANFDNEGNLRSILNMKSPINSSNDDFGIVFEGTIERGYFSSNRLESKGDDIYQFVLPILDLSISGVLTDEKTQEIIIGAEVTIIGTDGSFNKVVSDNSGRYVFDKESVKEGLSYEIMVAKDGYLSQNASETTEGVKESKEFVINISLEPTAAEIVLPSIEYDFNSSALRKESKMALDALIKVLNDNPNVVIELRSHTDNRDTDEFNLKLSQQRAQICVDYMLSNGIQPKRLDPRGMGELQPYVMTVKDGKLKMGDVLDEEFIDEIRRKKNKEKAHQYNRRTDFKVKTESFYDEETDSIRQRNL
jgi:peptidoglycan-associated lipoprotein